DLLENLMLFPPLREQLHGLERTSAGCAPLIDSDEAFSILERNGIQQSRIDHGKYNNRRCNAECQSYDCPGRKTLSFDQGPHRVPYFLNDRLDQTDTP